MKNGTPRGDGTSRYLRGADSVPTTYEAFRSMLLAGTLPVDFLLNPNGWLVQGTPLNAANLLSGDTAEKLGLTTEETQTVNHALSKLYELASQVEGHTHQAAEIAAGDFPAGEFSFGGKAPADRTRIRLRPTGAPVGAQYQGALEYYYPYTILRALTSPTEYVDLKLQGSTTGQTMISLTKGRGGNEDNYYLYGTHYKPTVSGGYTGDGATERRISLGGIPKVLFVASKSSMGGIAELAIIINFEGLTNLGAGESGITFLNVHGTPTMMNNQIYVASTQLVVGNHLGSNFFFNQPGVSYSYWGVRV